MARPLLDDELWERIEPSDAHDDEPVPFSIAGSYDVADINVAAEQVQRPRKRGTVRLIPLTLDKGKRS